jgi:hypothetical protein
MVLQLRCNSTNFVASFGGEGIVQDDDRPGYAALGEVSTAQPLHELVAILIGHRHKRLARGCEHVATKAVDREG